MKMTSTRAGILSPRALSREEFAPFGQVIEAGEGNNFLVNDGTAMRFHDLARIDVSEDHGHPCVSIFRAQARSLPLRLTMLERHPLSSQAFVPMGQARFLIIVALAGDQPRKPQAFVSSGHQGINYNRGTWHHPLIALDAQTDFLVMDRSGPGDNCDEFELAHKLTIAEID